MLRKLSLAPYKTIVQRRTGASSSASASTKAVLQLVRFDPEQNCSRVESYEYDKRHDYMVLDLLNAVKVHQDPTLAFRSSCGEGVCGSCAMNINGINSLACVTFAQSITTVAPLPNFPVVKDFVVDLRYFFQQYAFVRPFVRNLNLHRARVELIEAQYEAIARACLGQGPRAAAAAAATEALAQREEPVLSAWIRLAQEVVTGGGGTGASNRLLRVLETFERQLGVMVSVAMVEELLSQAATQTSSTLVGR